MESKQEDIHVEINLREFIVNSTILGGSLLKLLVPKAQDENTNYMPSYYKSSALSNHEPNAMGNGKYMVSYMEDKDLYTFKDRILKAEYLPMPFYLTNFIHVRNQFLQGHRQNLDVILFLSLVFGADDLRVPLEIIKSETTGRTYFTQVNADFFMRCYNSSYHNDVYQQMLNYNLYSFLQKIFIQHKYWWQQTGSTNATEQDEFLSYDLFNAMFRLYITPIELINRLVDSVCEEPYAHIFKKHISKILIDYRKNFYYLLNSMQTRYWNNNIKMNGKICFEEYLNDINSFKFYDLGKLNRVERKQMRQAMNENAQKLGMPNLDEYPYDRFRLVSLARSTSLSSGLRKSPSNFVGLCDLNQEVADDTTSDLFDDFSLPNIDIKPDDFDNEEPTDKTPLTITPSISNHAILRVLDIAEEEIALHPNPNELAYAYHILDSNQVVNDDVYDLLSKKCHPISLALAYCQMHAANLITSDFFACVRLHPRPLSLALALLKPLALKRLDETIMALYAHPFPARVSYGEFNIGFVSDVCLGSFIHERSTELSRIEDYPLAQRDVARSIAYHGIFSAKRNYTNECVNRELQQKSLSGTTVVCI